VVTISDSVIEIHFLEQMQMTFDIFRVEVEQAVEFYVIDIMLSSATRRF